MGKKICTVAECVEPMHAKGYCTRHYQQSRSKGGVVVGRKRALVSATGKCAQENCERDASDRGRGYCSAHHQRLMVGADMSRPIRVRRPPRPGEWTDWRVTGSGYVRRSRTVDGVTEYQTQHRHVMEGILGRKLLPGENVHHRNGKRDDNRPENLELWVVTQPMGARPLDKVEYAVQTLEEYLPDNWAPHLVQRLASLLEGGPMAGVPGQVAREVQ